MRIRRRAVRRAAGGAADGCEQPLEAAVGSTRAGSVTGTIMPP
jgi:hypothetical protein